VIQFSYQRFEQHRCVGGLFGWYEVAGAGSIVVGPTVARGLAGKRDLPWVRESYRISEGGGAARFVNVSSATVSGWELRCRRCGGYGILGMGLTGPTLRLGAWDAHRWGAMVLGIGNSMGCYRGAGVGSVL